MKKCEYLSGISILYVEDEEDIKEELVSFLQLRVKSLFTAADGEEGLGLFEQHRPDIVLSDINMPVLNGVEMSKQIRQIDKSVPILLLTAFSDSKYLFEAINCRVDRYVLKPVSSEELERILCIEAKNLIQERVLRNREKLLQEYKNAVDYGAVMAKCDLVGTITDVNDQFCKISGYSQQQLIGKNYGTLSHPHTRDGAGSAIFETVSNKRVWKGRVHQISNSGDEYFLMVTAVPIVDENDEIVECLMIQKDITELELLNRDLEKRVQQEVAKNSQKDRELIDTLNAVLESSPNPIVVYGDGKVKFANENFVALAKLPKEQLLDSDFNIETLFEQRSGFISSVEKMNDSYRLNKVSIKSEYGRNIFYIMENDIISIDNEHLRMFTLNNITVSEYQNIKIRHYSERLEDLVSSLNRLRMQQYDRQSEEYRQIRQTAQEITKERRELSLDESKVLKHSRKDRAFSAKEYARELDVHILDELQELSEIESEIDAELSIYESGYNIENLYNIGGRLLKYASNVKLLLEFGDLSFAIKSLSDLLASVETPQLDESKHRKIALFLSSLLMDISNWRRSIFVDQSANDIHYLDSSLFSSILQLELVINENQELEDENDLELF